MMGAKDPTWRLKWVFGLGLLFQHDLLQLGLQIENRGSFPPYRFHGFYVLLVCFF
jgi:hypothetical protein